MKWKRRISNFNQKAIELRTEVIDEKGPFCVGTQTAECLVTTGWLMGVEEGTNWWRKI